MSLTRAENELEHGRYLAESNPEEVWGWNTPAGKHRARRRAEMIRAGAGLCPGMQVLEVGCGTGLFTELLAESGADLIAVDISPELLALAEARNLPADRVRFLRARFEDCALEGPFDAVVGSSVLHHLDYRPGLARIFQMLKPGGHLSFAEPNLMNPQVMMQKNIPWMKRWIGDSPDETAFLRGSFARLLRKIGFVDVAIRPFDWLHPYTPSAAIPLVQSIGGVFEKIPLVREFAGSLYIHARKPE